MKVSIKIPGIIVVRNRNISLETQVVLLIFLIELETLNIRDDRTENTSKHRKMMAFVRNCLVKMTLRLFQLVSVVMTMGCQRFRGNSEDCYRLRRLSQGLLVCYVLLNSHQLIRVKKGWLLGQRNIIDQKAAEVAQRKEP